MIDRSRCLSSVLSLWLVCVPLASIAHEGHEHKDQGQTAAPRAGGPDASSQAQDDAEAERAAKRRQRADEDAAKAKAETPTPVAPRSDTGPH
jgi:hypothetical protein